MSTLPFLLSVADELDNLNSQSYMDDFGLGFHPHRQYYRTPTIQLSLPASTDWMQNERHRCRIHKFTTDDSQQNNLAEGEESEDNALDNDYGASTSNAAAQSSSHHYHHHHHHHQQHPHHNQHEVNQRHKYAKTISQANLEDDNLENTVQMYSLSKKCCKNYYRHASEPTKGKTSSDSVSISGGAGSSGGGGFKLPSKCLEGNNSSSDESLQKVSSSIEFLTCFLVKKSRANKAGSTTSSQAAAAAAKAADLAAASTSSALKSEASGGKKS